MKHGERGSDERSHCRWCDAHGWHGTLYSCPDYCFETLAEIALANAAMAVDLRDGTIHRRFLKDGTKAELVALVVCVIEMLSSGKTGKNP